MFAADYFGEGFYASDYFPPAGDVEVVEQFSGGYFDYEAHRPKFKPVGKEQRKAKRIVEKIAETILATPDIETNKEIDLILRLKLENEGLVYKQLYLRWLVKEAEIERKKKKHNKAIIMLLLH